MQKFTDRVSEACVWGVAVVSLAFMVALAAAVLGTMFLIAKHVFMFTAGLL